MITLNITALTAEELMNQIKDLHRQCAISGQSEMTLLSKAGHYDGPPIVDDSKTDVKEEPKAEKTKRKSAPKETAPAASTEVAAPAPTEVVNTGGITKEDIAEATQRVSAAKNLEVARSIVTQFKKADGSACSRLSDIQVSDYENYVATCNATIEG